MAWSCVSRALLLTILLVVTDGARAAGDIAVRARKLYPVSGPMIENGVVIARDGKIVAVGPAATTAIPAGVQVIEAAVATPGLIDAHSSVGLSGMLNQKQDQDQLESSSPIQPELRAVDAYNALDPLVEWLRGFGITTIHTGHAPGEVISGQTLIVKTAGNTVEEALVVETAAVAATLGSPARRDEKKSPGTRAKMMAMLRGDLIKAQEYAKKLATAEVDKKPERNLKSEVLARVLARELPLMVHANRAQDIDNVLRLADEFTIDVWLDGASEAYVLKERIKAAGMPVIIHPMMQRAYGDFENLSFETPAILRAAGIPVVFQSGHEGYVPKTRVVLFEAAIAAAHGLTFDQTLAAITLESARLLRIEKRVGSLEVGKDADIALYDGDPFEYTTHCTGAIINGRLATSGAR